MPQVENNSTLLKAWAVCRRFRMGRYAVAKAICFMAPYFGTIKPAFVQIEQGYVAAKFKNRRKVRNHLGSIHAIAMCNAVELVTGSCAEVSLHKDLRWIPVGMNVEYKKKAKSELLAICKAENYPDWQDNQQISIPVVVKDMQGDVVMSALVFMKISMKSKVKKF